MSRFLLIFILLLFKFGQAQENIQFNPLSHEHKNAKALVIGVSDYQHIKGLNYADSDALEFTRFLMENDAWGLKEENIQLLTNENAKQGDILMGLQWLLDFSKPGEDVIFYFSGHGDVEKVGEEKKGFLLAHDSPKNNYPIGGTLEISLLDSILVQLMQKEVKIWVIIDACRSGNLAGGISGKTQTSEALAKQWKSQVRMLSAQPDQLSYEDSLWGGGRGVFSYYLVKGMSGYANANNDSKITLNELESYLGNNITYQTNYTQQPHIEGPNKFSLGVSLMDNVQMKRYENDHIDGEVSLAMVSKAGEYEIALECRETAEELSSFLKEGLSSERFHRISTSWEKLNKCTKNDVPLTLQYHYMRSLINQINDVVNRSLSGEKMGLEPELKYGIKLIHELNVINKGKDYLGKEHFESVKHYLKSLLFTIYADYGSYLSDKKIPYRIDVKNYDVDDYNWNDVFGFQEELELNGLEKVNVVSAEKTDQGILRLVVEIEFFYLSGVIESLDEYLLGEVKVEALIEDDFMTVYNRISPDEKWIKHVNSWNFDKKHLRFLLDKLEKDCIKEPNSAYLYYSKAILYNLFKEKDSALLMLDICLELSPKWLNPLYSKGAIFRTMRKNKEAIETFEKVLDQEPIYQEFECVDCFFMGLVNLYLKEDRQDKIESTIDLWLEMRKDANNRWDLYFQLLTDPSAKKSHRKYWLRKMEMIDQTTVKDQFRWMYSKFAVYKRKYSDKEVLDFTHFLLKKINQGDSVVRTFFESSTVKRSSETDNKIMKDFFKDGRSFQYEDSIALIKSLAAFVEEKKILHLFGRKNLTQEYFMLSGLLRMQDVEFYLNWTNQLVYKKRRDGDFLKQIVNLGPFDDFTKEFKVKKATITRLETKLQNSADMDEFVREEIEGNIIVLKQEIEEMKFTDAGYNYAYIFGYDPDVFYELYASLYAKGICFNFLTTIYEEWGFQDEKMLREKCKTFTDFETLKKINELMFEFYQVE